MESVSVSSMRRICRGGLVAVATVLLVMFVVPHAQAAVRTGKSGSPGVMSAPTTFAGNLEVSMTLNVPAIYAPERVVTESYPYRNQWQYVCVTSVFWQDWYSVVDGNGQWDRVGQARNCAWISPSDTRSIVRGSHLEIGLVGWLRGDYATTFVVTWQLSSGTVVGRATYDYPHTYDYGCRQLALVFCQVTTYAVGNHAGIRLWA
jgi:hypothetical protein